ncbi:hypothetical protein SEA_RYADEL_102 [Mycobacterium phage Ryadel]|uniref:Uncharacterized protein n=1 Tax=Mycobacterium phage Ryadel TaxID=2283292 RepID=A0A345MF68_9CAUD|nr:hypothetical protein KNU03_gp102 [Mycobacterium phage Ryadel]AXH69199.1 hypothetical protein SEA_RYADEL_102 [Mycobacterium phage Ryadel]
MERAKAALEGVTEGPWTWTHGMDGHFRSDHRPNSGPCKIEGCECEGMKW